MFALMTRELWMQSNEQAAVAIGIFAAAIVASAIWSFRP